MISLSADPVIKLPEERRVKMARLGLPSMKGSGGVGVRVLKLRTYESKDVALKGLFRLSCYKSS